MSDERFDSLIIDPVAETRRRLKQVMTSVNEFRGVRHVSTISDAQGHLREGSATDVVFLSSTFEQNDLSSFIDEAKRSKGGRDSAYVAVLKDQDQEGSKAAQMMLVGADGLLFEPYSVDQLVDITKLAARVKKERGSARERAALELILDEAMGTLDLLATLRSDGLEPSTIKKQFKNSCEVLDGLDNERLCIYFQAAIDRFENAPLPADLPPAQRYKGVSRRVLDRVQRRLISDLETTLAVKKRSDK